jgi:hypothetical protein
MLELSTKESERAAHYWDGSWGTLIAAAAQGSNMGRFIWICALANRCVMFGVFYL